MLKLLAAWSAVPMLVWIGYAHSVVASSVHTKAIGGKPASPGNYPFQVALLKTDAYGDGTYPADEPLRALACAGTLLGGPWVLTAAHCVSQRSFDFSDPNEFPPANCLPEATGDICRYRPEALVVLAGTEELLPETGRRFRIKRIIVEDRYRTTTDEHDIALIELTEPALTSGSMLIADEEFTARAQSAGSLARAVGWGLVDETYGPHSVFLREINLPLQPLDSCRERHRLYEAWVNGVTWSDIDPENMVTTNMICAGWDGPPPQPNGETYDSAVLPNVCYGDSGGFVGIRDAGGRWVQIGIPSWLRDCKTPYIYGVHTNVAAYRDWIANTTGLSLPLPLPLP